MIPANAGVTKNDIKNNTNKTAAAAASGSSQNGPPIGLNPNQLNPQSNINEAALQAMRANSLSPHSKVPKRQGSNAQRGNPGQRQDSINMNSCDNSEPLDEFGMYASCGEGFPGEGSGFGGFAQSANHGMPVGQSSINNKISDKKIIFSTDIYVRRYSELSSVLEKRNNPLLKNKGNIQSRVFLDFQQMPTFQAEQKRSCHCLQASCPVCAEKTLPRHQNSRLNNDGVYISRKDRPTRQELAVQQQQDGQGRQSVHNLASHFGAGHSNGEGTSNPGTSQPQNYSSIKVNRKQQHQLENDRAEGIGEQSAQQGIEWEQAPRSDIKSHLSRSMDSQHFSKHIKNMEKSQQKCQYFMAQKSGSHYIKDEAERLSDDDGDNAHKQRGASEDDGDNSEQDAEVFNNDQPMIMKKKGGCGGRGQGAGRRRIMHDMEKSFNRTIQEQLKNGGGANGPSRREKGLAKSPSALGSSLNINDRGGLGLKPGVAKKKHMMVKKIANGGGDDDRASLQNQGSRDRFTKVNKLKEKARFKPSSINKDPSAASANLLSPAVTPGASAVVNLIPASEVVPNLTAEATGQSPPSGWVRAGQAITPQNLVNKVAGKCADVQKAMMSPFMKQTFQNHNLGGNERSGVIGGGIASVGGQEISTLQGASIDNLQNDKKKKQQQLQSQSNNNEETTPKLPLQQLELQKPKMRPLSHSSNNSVGAPDSSRNLKGVGEPHPLEKNQQFGSMNSVSSSIGPKSILMSQERKSSRKLLLSRGCLDSARVRFHESVGKYSEEEEEQKHYSNRRKYKKFPGSNKDGSGADKKDQPPAPPDVKIMIKMRRFVKEVNIKGTDPLISMPYSKYFLTDSVEKKKFLNDVEIGKHFVVNQRKTMLLNPTLIKQLQAQFLWKNHQQNQLVNINIKDLAQIKKAIKSTVKKTIVFDMDNTIMTIMYKKNEIQEYDAATYVKLFGHSALKIYLNYRPYLKEMLSELKKSDFEIILFSSHNSKYLEQVAATIQKDEPLFDFLINKDQLHFDRELDLHILDLNILLGTNPQLQAQGQTAQRDLKDIIVVSNTCCRHLIHYTNGIPVKEYSGNKRDLSLFALTKYLKSFKDVKDVRLKIIDDFGI